MKILFDTSILVEVDRHNAEVAHLLRKLAEKRYEFIISTITVAEILTGPYLCREVREAAITAKEILNQFEWKEIDGETAEFTAKLYSYLILSKKQHEIEYPDVLIAATFFSARCDAIITLNKKDFLLFPQLQGKVYTPEEFKEKFHD